MNAKTLVFASFAVWSLICWRWYVCGIKQACGPAAAAAAADVIQPSAIEPDTVATINLSGSDEAEAEPAQSNPSSSAPTASKPMTPSISEVQMEEVEDRMVIYFPYNSVRREDNDAIDDYLTRLAAYLSGSDRKVSITGHTDFVGEAKDNLRFGLLRAASIRDALVKKGVSKSQISIKSHGESKSIATNDTPQGRYKNRRVEIRVK
jgi:outer membrane protein OmpA-like peptidoglycan-associated protein